MGISQSAGVRSASLVSIQVLRGVAALLVLVGHATTALIVDQKAAAFPNFTVGPFGVDLFFVISGFVMVYSSERLFGHPDAPRKFFARRLARIVPLYWATSSVFIWFVVPYASTKSVLGSYFFTPHVPSEAPLLFVGWTLIYEMFFYTVFSIALFARRRLAVVAGAGVFLVLFALLMPAPKDASVGFFAPPASHSFGYLADPIIIEFVFGMIIALAYRAGVRFSLQATIISIAAAVVWYVLAVPAIPRQYSCGLAAALIVAGTSLSSLPTPKSGRIIRPRRPPPSRFHHGIYARWRVEDFDSGLDLCRVRDQIARSLVAVSWRDAGNGASHCRRDPFHVRKADDQILAKVDRGSAFAASQVGAYELADTHGSVAERWG